MNLLLATLQLASILLIVIYEYRQKYLSVFLWATLLILFGIPHFLGVLTNITDYSRDVMIQASCFVILFNMMYISVRFLLSKLNGKKIGLRKRNILTKSEIINQNDIRIKMSFFIMLIICPVILGLLAWTYLDGFTNASWGRFMILNRELGWWSPIKYILFIYFPAASVILSFKNDKNKLFYWLSIFAILIYVFISGNRVTILPLIVAIIIPFIFYRKKAFSFKNMIFLISIGGVSIYLIYFLRLLRVYGGFYTLFSDFNLFSINNLVFQMLLNGDGELSLRNAFYYFIEKDNNFPNFNEGQTYIRILLLGIPTSLSFGIKPPDFAISMGSAWINDFSNTIYSMTPTLYGDIFANFWWFGIGWGIFWAIVNFIVDKIANRKNSVIKSILMVLFGTLFIAIGRGSVYNQFFIAFISLILIFIVYLLTKIRLKKSN